MSFELKRQKKAFLSGGIVSTAWRKRGRERKRERESEGYESGDWRNVGGCEKERGESGMRRRNAFPFLSL